MNFTQDQKAMVYVLGSLVDLRDAGMLKVEDTLMPKGIAAYDQMKASGYQPSDWQIMEVVQVLLASKYLVPTQNADVKNLYCLVKDWRDGKIQKFLEQKNKQSLLRRILNWLKL